MTLISGADKKVWDWLEKIGVNIKYCSRVILDIPCDGIIRVYTERTGGEEIFADNPFDGVLLRHCEKRELTKARPDKRSECLSCKKEVKIEMFEDVQRVRLADGMLICLTGDSVICRECGSDIYDASLAIALIDRAYAIHKLATGFIPRPEDKSLSLVDYRDSLTINEPESTGRGEAADD